MKKGFSGIEELADSNHSHITKEQSVGKVDIKKDSIDTSKNDKPTLEATVVSAQKFPTMPAYWHSEDEGVAWEWGDYILILQKNPATMEEYLRHISQKSQSKH